MQNPFPRHPRGFTLVELLVVIVIVVTLAALSFFGLARMRSAGDKAATVQVLRQLQIANAAFASEHGGQYVPQSSKDENSATTNPWHENSVFLSYLTGDPTALDRNQPLKTVPVSILDPKVVRAKERLWQKLFASYAYNVIGVPTGGPSSDKSFKTSQIKDSTRTASFVTATDWILKYEGRFLWESSPVEGKSTDGKIAYRHDGKAIVTYYDGSSGTFSAGDVRGFDKNGGNKNPFWLANFPDSN